MAIPASLNNPYVAPLLTRYFPLLLLGSIVDDGNTYLEELHSYIMPARISPLRLGLAIARLVALFYVANIVSLVTPRVLLVETGPLRQRIGPRYIVLVYPLVCVVFTVKRTVVNRYFFVRNSVNRCSTTFVGECPSSLKELYWNL